MEVLNVDCQDIDFSYTFTNSIGRRNTSLGDKSEIPKSQIKKKKKCLQMYVECTQILLSIIYTNDYWYLVYWFKPMIEKRKKKIPSPI